HSEVRDRGRGREGSRHGMRGRGGLYERKVENERGKDKQTDRERESQREMNGYLHRCSCQCCGRLNHRICREYLRGWSHNHLGPATKTGSTQRQGEGEERRREERRGEETRGDEGKRGRRARRMSR